MWILTSGGKDDHQPVPSAKHVPTDRDATPRHTARKD